MPPPPSLSLLSLIQYLFFTAIIYILAGAPLSNILGQSTFSRGADSHHGRHGNRNLSSLNVPEGNLVCGAHAYKGVHVLSREPLVVYIEGFLSGDEVKWVVDVSSPHFEPSTIWTAGQELFNPAVRKSEKAALPRDHVVKCIEERARGFQGWKPFVFIEKLWAQRYAVGGHYTYHFDWSMPTPKSGRLSSFMVYLDGNCTGGGTHFPRLPKPQGSEWCKFIECDVEQEDLKDGVIFKPVAGNAVYWDNIRPDGTGYAESWHAGLPVKSGRKIGMNIWSWLQVGYVPPTGEE